MGKRPEGFVGKAKMILKKFVFMQEFDSAVINEMICLIC
jgi:hypothetical protein